MPDLLTDDELAAVLTAIDNLGELLTDPPPRFRARAGDLAQQLADAENKLRVLHGLPPNHPAGA